MHTYVSQTRFTLSAFQWVSVSAAIGQYGYLVTSRWRVIAYTGLPHALVKKLTAEAIDWRAKTVAVPARKKGKGAQGVSCC
jgi:hypothetical protein